MVYTNLRDVPAAIANREDFEGNSISGYVVQNGTPSLPSLGALSYEWRERFYADRELGIWYIVFSYDTPIAWVTGSGDDKHTVIVDQRFSVTTSKHQGKVRYGFSLTD